MVKAQNRITVLDVIREIHRQASGLVAVEALDQEDLWRLGSLRGAISVLLEVAEKANDLELYALLDDLEYACNHIGLANLKAEDGLHEASAKIELLALGVSAGVSVNSNSHPKAAVSC